MKKWERKKEEKVGVVSRSGTVLLPRKHIEWKCVRVVVRGTAAETWIDCTCGRCIHVHSFLFTQKKIDCLLSSFPSLSYFYFLLPTHGLTSSLLSWSLCCWFIAFSPEYLNYINFIYNPFFDSLFIIILWSQNFN